MTLLYLYVLGIPHFANLSDLSWILQWMEGLKNNCHYLSLFSLDEVWISSCHGLNPEAYCAEWSQNT